MHLWGCLSVFLERFHWGGKTLMWASSSHRLGFKTSKERRKGRGGGSFICFCFLIGWTGASHLKFLWHAWQTLSSNWVTTGSSFFTVLSCQLLCHSKENVTAPRWHGEVSEEEELLHLFGLFAISLYSFLNTSLLQNFFNGPPDLTWLWFFFYSLYLKIETNSRKTK